ncbi:MAG: S-layer homology domain-containing protein, partial [Clostridia bacterium]|nr:S-layer homology domain-containing protein [Clostridia bacterium]
MKKILSLILSAFLLATSCVAPVFADNTDLPTGDNMLVIAPNPMANAAIFKDVEKDSGLETALKKLVDAGIVKGYEDGTFRPSSTLSRAEFCRMVNQLFKYTEKADYGFYDVQQTDWFYDEVLIAKKQGYIQGFEDATFRGNSKITREQVCTILNRILGLYVLYDVQISDTVSDWALSSVQAVVSNGFMSLEEGNTFRATQDITRQEFAYLFVPFCDATNPNPDGGNTPGGNEGGNTPGGNTPGGNEGGNTPGGNTPGGNEGGNTPGGNTPGGNEGGNTPGGNTPGGNEGGNTPGGNTPGGNEGG